MDLAGNPTWKENSPGDHCHDDTMNFICNLTREAILVPCSKTITAKETARLYFKNVFPRTGLPKVIHSERGPQLIAQLWKYL